MRRGSHGFILLEMFYVLGALAVFFLLVTSLFSTSVRAFTAAGPMRDSAGAFDAAVRILRGDLAAGTGAVVAERSIRITSADGGAVEWRGRGHGLERQVGSATRRWEVGAAVRFSSDGAVILLTPAGTADAGAVAISVPSSGVMR